MNSKQKKVIIVCHNNSYACIKASDILKEYYNVLGILFINDEEQNRNDLNIRSFKSEELHNIQYDKLLIVSGRLCIEDTINKLQHCGVKPEQIDTSYIDAFEIMRDVFMQRYSMECDIEKRGGNCAECGVYKGDFAKRINKFFPNRKLYLFDYFNDISENELLCKMPHPQKCEVKKGDFLETSKNIQDLFCYVHLDFHSSEPTTSALYCFASKMSTGGIIAVHDYFSKAVGVKKSVDTFLKNNPNLTKIIMGGGSEIAIVGF